MGKLIIPKLSDKIRNAEIVHEVPTEEYKQAVKEANERIKENRRREAQAWINASTYVSD